MKASFEDELFPLTLVLVYRPSDLICLEAVLLAGLRVLEHELEGENVIPWVVKNAHHRHLVALLVER